MNKIIIMVLVLMFCAPFNSYASYSVVRESNQYRVEFENGDTLFVYTVPVKQGGIVFVHLKGGSLPVSESYRFKGIEDNNIVLEVSSAYLEKDQEKIIKLDIRSTSTEILTPFKSLPKKLAIVYVEDVKIKLKVINDNEILAEVIERRAGDPATLIASSEKAKKILGWKPEFESLEKIIIDAWKWHENNPDGYND